MTEQRELFDLDVKRIFSAIWRNIVSIALVGLLGGALLFSYAYFFVTPQYEANIKLYVNNTNAANVNGGYSSSQIVAAQELAQTYMVILKSHSVLDEVIATSNLGYTYGQLYNMVSASAVNNTEVFQVSVRSENYLHAAALANAIAGVLPEKIAAVVDGSSVRVVDYALASRNRVFPSYTIYAIVGVLAGAVLASLFVVFVDLLDNTIAEEEYLVETYEDIPLLAVIPDAVVYKTSSYYKGYYARDHYAEKMTDGGAK